MPNFPTEFLWGAATSAYQIEGSPLADGAGPSIWHRFAHTPGRTQNDENGDIACDHYRRYEDDVKLMGQLGLQAYRFSISWSRIFPEGVGRINSAGLDFYQRLVDALLVNGIESMVTLYHWDLPAALDDRGGWLNPDCAHWFGQYAQALFQALDDRVKYWITLNEPWVVTDAGYVHGVHAPGHSNPDEAPRAALNLLRAHGNAVQAYRAHGRHEIGISINLEPKMPASQAPDDLAAAERADAYMNRQYLDPVFFGQFPQTLREMSEDAWPAQTESELKMVSQPIDFLGINYYTRSVVRDNPAVIPDGAERVRQAKSTHTDLDWEIYPQGLADTLAWVKARYGNVPLYVTENGAAFADPVPAKGIVQDPARIEYVRLHLQALHDAIQQGVNLRGYFVWSLLDNFEWGYGYSKRFGIVYVDYNNQKRILKDSARFYQKVIDTQGRCVFDGY